MQRVRSFTPGCSIYDWGRNAVAELDDHQVASMTAEGVAAGL